MMVNQRKKVVVAISGSIAAYKVVDFVRLLVKRRFEVRVVMTPSATKFIAPLTFQTVSRNSVLTSLWEEEDGIGHIEYADWADVVVLVPASANTIAKLAHGMADNAVLAVALATKAPLVLAPAMNVNMWENGATQANIKTLKQRGMRIVEPEKGELACGWMGSGRLASKREIYWCVERALTDQDLLGKRVLVTAGPTREEIDPVRYLTNRSSGRMGVSLALDAYRRGASVTLVNGPLGYQPAIPIEINRVPVLTAQQMKDAVQCESQTADIVIMAAAVADFRPLRSATQKLKKSDGFNRIDLIENDDIIASLGKLREGGHPLLVAFSVETDTKRLHDEARRKLRDKRVDLLIANSASEAFDKKTNQVWIVSDENVVHVDSAHKLTVARKILNAVAKKLVENG